MKWIKSLFFLALTIVTFSCSKEELECINCTDISLAKDMKVSIIGDSYSTFKGYLSPSSNPTYYPKIVTEVTEVSHTWWHQLITQNQLRLECNNSYSGSTVAAQTKCEWEFIRRTLSGIGQSRPDFCVRRD